MTVSKRRFKYLYRDSARSQMDVEWGKVFVVGEAPPGAEKYFDSDDTGRGYDTYERRSPERYISSSGDDSRHVWIRRETDTFLGAADSAYSFDGTRFADWSPAGPR